MGSSLHSFFRVTVVAVYPLGMVTGSFRGTKTKRTRIFPKKNKMRLLLPEIRLAWTLPLKIEKKKKGERFFLCFFRESFRGTTPWAYNLSSRFFPDLKSRCTLLSVISLCPSLCFTIDPFKPYPVCWSVFFEVRIEKLCVLSAGMDSIRALRLLICTG